MVFLHSDSYLTLYDFLNPILTIEARLSRIEAHRLHRNPEIFIINFQKISQTLGNE